MLICTIGAWRATGSVSRVGCVRFCVVADFDLCCEISLERPDA